MNKQQFLSNAEVEVQTLEFWIEQEWLIPDRTSDEDSFSDTDVARAHLIHDLMGDFGVNDEGVDVILHLVDQLHGLRRAFEQLQKDMQGSPR
jgi:chaperone modulatory protein CbpM